MHRHREGFSGGAFNFTADFSASFSDSTVRSSLSSISTPGGPKEENSDDEFFNSWERKPSKFVEATFRNSETSQDDMAIPPRTSTIGRSSLPSNLSTSRIERKKDKYRTRPKKTTTPIPSVDDSNVGNYHAVRPKSRPHPNLQQQQQEASKRYYLEKQGGKLALSNTNLSEELSAGADLSSSLVGKLGKSPVMNQNKAVGRRRASTAALTGTNSRGSSYDEEDGRDRSKTPVRRGRSNSMGAKYEEEPEANNYHTSKERDAQRSEHRREAAARRQQRSQSGESKRHNRAPSGEHHRSPRAPSGDRPMRDRSGSNEGSSRRHHTTKDDSSRRNHKRRGGADSNSPEGTKSRDRDSNSPSYGNGDHRRRREKPPAHEKTAHAPIRRKRSHSLPSKEHGRDRNRERERKGKQVHRRRSHSLSPKGRGGRERPEHNNRHGHPPRMNRRARQSASPPELEKQKEPPAPASPGPRRTRGSIMIMDAPPAPAPAPAPARARGSIMIMGNVPPAPARGPEKHGPRSHHHRKEKHGGGHHERHGHHRHHHREGEGPHKKDRKPRPPLKRFKSKSTGHLPAKRSSKRGSTRGKNSSKHSREGRKTKGTSKHGRSTDGTSSVGSNQRRQTHAAASAPGDQAAASRNRRSSAPDLESLPQQQQNPPPRARRRASVGDRMSMLQEARAQSLPRFAKDAEPSVRQLTVDAGRRRSISPARSKRDLLTNQHTGSKSSRFKDALLKQESIESEEAERPAVRRHSSLSRLETKSRKSLFLNPQQMPVMLSRTRMGFLDEAMSFSDSDSDNDEDDVGRQMSQDRLVRSIQNRLHASDVTESPDDFAAFSDFDMTDNTPASEEQFAHPHRMTNNLDHVDLTALRASQVQEVLARARTLNY